MFYGADQARIHHVRFGDLARNAARLVISRLHDAGVTAGTVVDLGSGSGLYAAAMSDAGYAVVGVDISPDMVALARATAPRATFTVGSVYDAQLPRAVAITALGEVVNYATDTRAGLDALAALAARVHDALEPGGLFVFDVATPGRGSRGERFVDGGDWAIGVLFDEHDTTLERIITIFAADDDGDWRRVDEHHVLRLYTVEAVGAILEAAGFTYEVLDGYAGPVDFPGWNVFLTRRV